MNVRVRNTETGFEFGLDVDCFQHGHASRRIGMPRSDNPFADATTDQWQSWVCGYRAAELGEPPIPPLPTGDERQ